MDNQTIITVAKRTTLKYHGIWNEDVLEETGHKCIKFHDSISQEEFLRLCVMEIIDREGFMTKMFPLRKVFIRPTIMRLYNFRVFSKQNTLSIFCGDRLCLSAVAVAMRKDTA